MKTLKRCFIITLTITVALSMAGLSFAADETPTGTDPTEATEPTDPTEPEIVEPAVPVISVTSKYNNKAKIKWKMDENAAGYQIYRNNKVLDMVDSPPYLDTKLKTGKKYKYKVCAFYYESDTRQFTAFSKSVTIKAKYRNPKLLMVDNRSDNKRVVTQFRKVGVKVITVYDLSKVEPSEYDGLIIPGGNNMDPRSYGEPRSKYTFGTDKQKDELQIAAVWAFVDAGKPVLGICRGCQVVNVAFGGTLKQHIPGWHKKYRKIRTVKGSWIYKIYGSKRNTYHYHHQCVKKLGDGLMATAYDVKDGHIEAVQHETLPVYGVQWHPDLKPNKISYKFYRAFKRKCLRIMAR